MDFQNPKGFWGLVSGEYDTRFMQPFAGTFKDYEAQYAYWGKWGVG